MINWHIGCSGFHYKHWKGTFYPEDLAQSKWFDHYCNYFNTLELNVSFYRFPRLSSLEGWREKSPEGFRFSIKAPRAITHFKKFSGVTSMLSDFYRIAGDGLQHKLSCVLFQLPPNFHYSEEHLDRIIKSLDKSFVNVLEFRHNSWWKPEIYERLGEENIVFCGMSHPELPGDVISTTPILYYRLHGEGQLYASNYSSSQLESIVDKIKLRNEVKEVYIYFNNDIHSYAVYNALDIKKMI